MKIRATHSALHGPIQYRFRAIFFAGLAILCGGVCLSFASWAQSASQPELDVQIEPPQQTERDAALDKLFAELKATPDEDESELISNKIYSRFRQSGSDTLDLMATRARDAMAKGELPVAVEILSRVIKLEPTWAEAWNLRATAFFLMGDTDRAKSDAIETLAREPRHIGALTGLALIFEMEGRPKDALKAYRQVLLLAPQLKPIKTAAERLAKELEQPM